MEKPTMNVTQAVRQRISTRAFLDTPISQEDLGDLLATAQRSPSGGNLQPWRTIAVAGAARDRSGLPTLSADPVKASLPGQRLSHFPKPPPAMWPGRAGPSRAATFKSITPRSPAFYFYFFENGT
jgi:hypothetical protein